MFRRFLASLDPALNAKCFEQDATDLEEVLAVMEQGEKGGSAKRVCEYLSRHPSGCGAFVYALYVS